MAVRWLMLAAWRISCYTRRFPRVANAWQKPTHIRTLRKYVHCTGKVLHVRRDLLWGIIMFNCLLWITFFLGKKGGMESFPVVYTPNPRAVANTWDGANSKIDITNILDAIEQKSTFIDVQFCDIKSLYEKDQKKVHKNSTVKGYQVVIKGKINFMISTNADIRSMKIEAFVRRTAEAAEKMNKPIDLKGDLKDPAHLDVKLIESNTETGHLLCQVDIGGRLVKTISDDELFKLATTLTAERNKFEIVVHVYIRSDTLPTEFVSNPFLVKSKKRDDKKRSKSNTFSVPINKLVTQNLMLS